MFARKTPPHNSDGLGPVVHQLKGEMRRKKGKRRKGMERVAGEEEKRKISEAIRWTAC